MEIQEWINTHIKLGTLRGKTGTRLIKILNKSGVVYMHELKDVELRRFKGCGKKTFELWNYLTNLRYFHDVIPYLYESHKQKGELEERVNTLESQLAKLNRDLAHEKHLSRTTNFKELRQKLLNDNA